MTIALANSWFAPYFDRLGIACSEIFDDFGRWTDKSKFDAISDMVEEIVQERVARIWDHEDGSYSIFVHHSLARA